MNCPFCLQEMEDGVLQSTHGMYWLKEPVRFPIKPSSKKEAQSVFTMETARDFPFIRGHRCPNCHAIVIDPE